MSTQPDKQTSSLQIVGYGIENKRANARKPMMTLLLHNITVKRDEHLFIPLVRLSDAAAAIDADRIGRYGGLEFLQALQAARNKLRDERDALAAECVKLRALVIDGGEALPVAGVSP